LSLDKCFEERKLRKERPDMLKAQRSLLAANEKLEEAQALAKAGFASSALLNAYASMFHAGRALLFRDGIVEKSHYCLIAYLRENYAKTGRLSAGTITMMDAFREERHDVLYSLEGIKVKPDETSAAIGNAKKLLEGARKLLE